MQLPVVFFIPFGYRTKEKNENKKNRKKMKISNTISVLHTNK